MRAKGRELERARARVEADGASEGGREALKAAVWRAWANYGGL